MLTRSPYTIHISCTLFRHFLCLCACHPNAHHTAWTFSESAQDGHKVTSNSAYVPSVTKAYARLATPSSFLSCYLSLLSSSITNNSVSTNKYLEAWNRLMMSKLALKQGITK